MNVNSWIIVLKKSFNETKKMHIVNMNGGM